MEPAVVIWAINQRPLVGSAFAAVFKTYQEPPVRVLTFKDVLPVPGVAKKPEIVGVSAPSSTRDGSAASPVAGPSKPMVA